MQYLEEEAVRVLRAGMAQMVIDLVDDAEEKLRLAYSGQSEAEVAEATRALAELSRRALLQADAVKSARELADILLATGLSFECNQAIGEEGEVTVAAVPVEFIPLICAAHRLGTERDPNEMSRRVAAALSKARTA